MQRNQLVVTVSIVVTFILGAVASFVPLNWAWGLNHLQFLPSWYSWIYMSLAILAVSVILLPIKLTALDSLVETTDRILWGEKHWHRVAFALAFIPLFYSLRVETYFLGDGYGWLSNLSHEGSYIHKWTEYGSIPLVRSIQFLQGGFTKSTALRAFQILSITSGSIVIYNFVGIVGKLCHQPSVRLLGLSTLIFSGTLLLFCGYVEFYSLSWAASSLFVCLSIGYLKDSKKLWLVVMVFLLSLFLHVQIIFFALGLAFLIILTARSSKVRKALYGLLGIAVAGGIVTLIWLAHTRVGIEVLFLPLFQGRPTAPDYFLFSLPHLKDLSQQLFLIYPGALVLLTLWLRQKPFVKWDKVSSFLGLLSAGSLTFLIIFGAALTRARDWDVMSLSLFAPVLLVLYQIDRKGTRIELKTLFSYALLSVSLTSLFLSVNLMVGPSEDRYYSLLSYQEDKNHSGWAILANYYERNGNLQKQRKITGKMRVIFPEYEELKQGYKLLESGRYNEAQRIADRLINKNPYDRAFLKYAGGVYRRIGDYPKSERLLLRAERLSPYLSTLKSEIAQMYMDQQRYAEALPYAKEARHLSPELTFIAETLGLIYYRLDHYDSTLAVADSLFADDRNSPGGHLLNMIVAITSANQDKARIHYLEYLRYGKNRSDYQRIKQSYQFLLTR